jgi:methylthioribose-1-phosphate isomerase
VDLDTLDGSGIVIEERQADEVLCCGPYRAGPEGAKVRNPAFDVTPHALIAGFITDRGILRPPFGTTLARHFSVSSTDR